MIKYIVRDDDECLEWRNQDGELHRESGFAVEWKNADDDEWWLNDVQYFSECEYLKEVEDMKEGKLVEVDIDLEKDVILELALAAHERDITLNELIVEALEEAVDKDLDYAVEA